MSVILVPDADISRYFERVFQFIKYHTYRGLPVLIHCAAGISRSSTLAAYCLMRRYGMSLHDALIQL